MQRLSETQVKILFVVDEMGKLLGTVNDGDLRRGLIRGLKFSDRVDMVMSSTYVSVLSGAPDRKDYAKHLMIKTKIAQIPVIDESGVIVDLILWTDVLDGDPVPGEKILEPNQVVIMAGGKGSRLDPFTNIFPKPLIPLGNRPVIDIIMDRFYQSGFHRFI
jgi:CBS domain-containing protein